MTSKSFVHTQQRITHESEVKMFPYHGCGKMQNPFGWMPVAMSLLAKMGRPQKSDKLDGLLVNVHPCARNHRQTDSQYSDKFYSKSDYSCRCRDLFLFCLDLKNALSAEQ